MGDLPPAAAAVRRHSTHTPRQLLRAHTHRALLPALLLPLLLLAAAAPQTAAATAAPGVVWVRPLSTTAAGGCTSACRAHGSTLGLSLSPVTAGIGGGDSTAQVCGVALGSVSSGTMVPGTRFVQPAGCGRVRGSPCPPGSSAGACVYAHATTGAVTAAPPGAFSCLCATAPVARAAKWVNASAASSGDCGTGMQPTSPYAACKVSRASAPGRRRAGRDAVGYLRNSSSSSSGSRVCITGVHGRRVSSSAAQLCVTRFLDGSGGGGGGGGSGCATLPGAASNASAWACNGAAGAATRCAAQCSPGFNGSLVATCTSSGSWAVSGQCVPNTSGGINYRWVALASGFSSPACAPTPAGLDACLDAWCAHKLGQAWHALRVAPASGAASLAPEAVCAAPGTALQDAGSAANGEDVTIDAWLLGAAIMTDAEQPAAGTYGGLCYVSVVLPGQTAPAPQPPFAEDAAAALLCSDCAGDACWRDFLSRGNTSGSSSSSAVTAPQDAAGPPCSMPAPAGLGADLPTVVLGTVCRFALQSTQNATQWYAGSAPSGTFDGAAGCLTVYDATLQPYTARPFDLLCPGSGVAP